MGKELAKVCDLHLDARAMAQRGDVVCKFLRVAEIVAPARGQYSIRWAPLEQLARVLPDNIPEDVIERDLAVRVGRWS